MRNPCGIAGETCQLETRNRSLSKDRATEIAATVSRYVQRTQITHPGEPICHC
jgi:hypothetical protein